LTHITFSNVKGTNPALNIPDDVVSSIISSLVVIGVGIVLINNTNSKLEASDVALTSAIKEIITELEKKTNSKFNEVKVDSAASDEALTSAIKGMITELEGKTNSNLDKVNSKLTDLQIIIKGGSIGLVLLTGGITFAMKFFDIKIK
jgi:hypothetical protein